MTEFHFWANVMLRQPHAWAFPDQKWQGLRVVLLQKLFWGIQLVDMFLIYLPAGETNLKRNLSLSLWDAKANQYFLINNRGGDQTGATCAITLNYCTYTNHVGVSPRALYCVVDLAMGLADLMGIADLHCRKVESTKWLKHKLRATIGGQ